MILATISNYLGNDAEVKTFGEREVINFSVAENRSKYNKQTKEYEHLSPVWIQCKIWCDPGTGAKKVEDMGLAKGSYVVAQGTLEFEEFMTKDNQVMEAKTLTIAPRNFLSSSHAAIKRYMEKSQGESQAQYQQPASAQAPAAALDDNDLPF